MNNELNKKILSDLTVHMKYAKFIPELNRRETWNELVTRNKEMHQKRYPQLTDQIQLAYKYVYDKKVLPSMRSLQFSGKPIEISPNRLYNCSYLPIDHVDSFSECMFLLLSGCVRPTFNTITNNKSSCSTFKRFCYMRKRGNMMFLNAITNTATR